MARITQLRPTPPDPAKVALFMAGLCKLSQETGIFIDSESTTILPVLVARAGDETGYTTKAEHVTVILKLNREQ